MAMAGRKNLHWIASLKEQRRIGGLSGSGFWSAKPIWVLGFLLQLKADLCVWRNREESVICLISDLWVWRNSGESVACILIGETDLGFMVFVTTQDRSVCLKEQRRVCSYEFWSEKALWVLGFLVFFFLGFFCSLNKWLLVLI